MDLDETGSALINADASAVEDAHDVLEDKRREWEANRDLGHAADLLATAVVSGNLDPAREAIEFILSSSKAGVGLRSVALAVSGAAEEAVPEPVDALEGRHVLGRAVKSLREGLRIYPQSAVSWVDLARVHIRCGNEAAARRAMLTALDLGYENRFVLRSAARMFVHLDEPDRAHGVLSRAARTGADPWLMGAEIAVADAMKRTSPLIREGRAAIERGNFSPHATAELAAAIGTLDATAGKKKTARHLFRTALSQPTENVVAQALWVSRNTDVLGAVDQEVLKTPHSHEANAWAAMYAKRWQDALVEGKKWFAHEPYSSRAAILTTYVAATALGMHSEAAMIAEVADRASPGNVMLLNNWAFALASAERVSEAVKVFGRIKRVGLDARTEITLKATEGLLAFRSREPERGRQLYAEAIRAAVELGLSKPAALAAAYYAREEARIGTERGQAALGVAQELADRFDCDEARLVLDGVKTIRGIGAQDGRLIVAPERQDDRG